MNSSYTNVFSLIKLFQFTGSFFYFRVIELTPLILATPIFISQSLQNTVGVLVFARSLMTCLVDFRLSIVALVQICCGYFYFERKHSEFSKEFMRIAASICVFIVLGLLAILMMPRLMPLVGINQAFVDQVSGFMLRLYGFEVLRHGVELLSSCAVLAQASKAIAIANTVTFFCYLTSIPIIMIYIVPGLNGFLWSIYLTVVIQLATYSMLLCFCGMNSFVFGRQGSKIFERSKKTLSFLLRKRSKESSLDFSTRFERLFSSAS